MKFKPGVSIFGLRQEMFFAMDQIDKMLLRTHWPEYEATCTSGTDGQHSRTSLHHDGRAIDIRTKDLPDDYEPDAYRNDIEDRLSADFDVVLEPTHIHIEWQPKKP